MIHHLITVIVTLFFAMSANAASLDLARSDGAFALTSPGQAVNVFGVLTFVGTDMGSATGVTTVPAPGFDVSLFATVDNSTLTGADLLVSDGATSVLSASALVDVQATTSGGAVEQITLLMRGLGGELAAGAASGFVTVTLRGAFGQAPFAFAADPSAPAFADANAGISIASVSIIPTPGAGMLMGSALVIIRLVALSRRRLRTVPVPG